MRDKKIGQILFAPKSFEQIHDLSLNRYVKCGYWFISNDKIRIYRQGPGYSNSLALTTRKLMRIAFDKSFAETNCFQQLLNSTFTIFAAGQTKRIKWFTDNLANRHARIQRRIWILKDHLEIPALLPEITRV